MSNVVLPLGMPPMDRVLPEGGLALGALHDLHGEAGPLAGFAAFLLGRVATRGRPVLWIDGMGDLYLPGLQLYGLDADNLIVADGIAGDKATLWALHEAVSTPALGAVAASLHTPDFTALRRLSLAAREQGVTAFLMRREGALGASPAVTRWHVAAAPSHQNGLPGVGDLAWSLTLEKCRNGPEGVSFHVVKEENGWHVEPDRSASDHMPLVGMTG